MFNLKHREKLLVEYSTAFKSFVASFKNVRIESVQASLMLGSETLKEGSASEILDYIVNDIYWDENGNWSDADGVCFDLI